MKIEHALKEYLLEIEVRRYTPRTIRSYRNNLNLFLRFCQERLGIENVDEITLGTVKAYTKFLVGAGKASACINSILKTVKSFVQYCYDENYGCFNTKLAFKWRKVEKPVILTFTPAHVRQMLTSCNGYDFLSSIPRRRLQEIILSSCVKGNSGKMGDYAETGTVHRTTCGHFLSKGKWDDVGLEETQKRESFQAISELSRENGTPLFVSIDDTVLPKTVPSSRAKRKST